MNKTKYPEGTYAYHSTKVHYNKLEFKHLFHKMRFEKEKKKNCQISCGHQRWVKVIKTDSVSSLMEVTIMHSLEDVTHTSSS